LALYKEESVIFGKEKHNRLMDLFV